MELAFAEVESTFDYFRATRRYLERHGKPMAFYSDRLSVFHVYARDRAPTGRGLSQFGRALRELNIAMRCSRSRRRAGLRASSPGTTSATSTSSTTRSRPRRLRGAVATVSEAEDGTVTIRANGEVLPARLYPKDHAHLDPGVVVDHEHLDGVFDWIAAQQQERDALRLDSRKLTRREKQRIRAGSGLRTPAALPS